MSNSLLPREKILFEAFMHMQDAFIMYHYLLGIASFDEDVSDKYEEGIDISNKAIELIIQYQELAK